MLKGRHNVKCHARTAGGDAAHWIYCTVCSVFRYVVMAGVKYTATEKNKEFRFTQYVSQLLFSKLTRKDESI